MPVTRLSAGGVDLSAAGERFWILGSEHLASDAYFVGFADET